MTPKRLSFKLLIVLFIIIFNYSHALAKPSRILIMPFDIHSDKDLSFLVKGVETMLSSRLAQDGKVLPLTRASVQQAIPDIQGPFDDAKALVLGTQLDVEYAIIGTITLFGDSISTDARFLDVKSRKPLVIFNQFGKSQGDVLHHVNLFAAEVNDRVFGRKTMAYRKTETEIPKVEAERRKHPNTLIRSDQSGAPLRMGLNQSGIWRSRRYKTDLVGVAVGDVDEDGSNETVFISHNRVFINRYRDGAFQKLKEFAGKPTDHYISVDVADINHNGRAEIFVTNHPNEDQLLSSFVLEWNGKVFKRISSGDKWYYRVNREDGKEPMLIGQKRGLDVPFSPRIHKMKWQGGSYIAAERLNLPKKTNLYGFAFGDAKNDGVSQILAFSPNSRLRLFDTGGQEIWKSKDRYGGSTLYVEFPMDSASIGDVKEMDRVYLPQRILVADVDQDGNKEVVVIKNQDLAGRLIKRFRYFEEGLIEGLIWDQFGLRRIWTTREFSGPIIDFSFADMDNDKQAELVMAVSADSSPLIGDEKSYIVMMEVAAQENN